MKKLTAEQSMMTQKLLSLFKNKGDVKTVKEIHQELIGRINFSISSTYFCFIGPLVSRGYLKVLYKAPQADPPLPQVEIERCY